MSGIHVKVEIVLIRVGCQLDSLFIHYQLHFVGIAGPFLGIIQTRLYNTTMALAQSRILDMNFQMDRSCIGRVL